MTTPIGWTIEEILKATGGELLSGDAFGRFSAIRIDSRSLKSGEVFVAIQGERFNGHDFISDVVQKKAGCVVIQQDRVNQYDPQYFNEHGCCCVVVDDTVSALGNLAAYRRRQVDIPVVAITGSTGKTTTREMLTSICRQQFETLSTSGNFNNEIGLPLTLFNLAPEHQLVLLELGMNHPGEIRRLSAICSPEIGVITNIGPAHLEGLRDVASVARAKGELLENIRPGGIVVLNADDEYGRKLKETAKNPVVMFGSASDAKIRCEEVVRKNDRVTFSLAMPEVRMEINLNVYGEFMVQNALAAAAVAHLLEIEPEKIKTGLESFRAVEGRMVIYETSGGVYIIDDTYNANPMSMKAAIDALTGLTGKKRGILVAGDMLELGDAAKYYHEVIGQTAANAAITRLYLTGAYAAQVAQGAKSAGMAGSDIFVGTKTDIVKNLSGWLQQGDWVLVKGSRSTGMEEIVKQLTKDACVHKPDHLKTEGSGK